MNLAARLYLNEVQRDQVFNELEAVLTAILPGWQSWEFHPPAGVAVFGAFESATAAARLHAVGFESVGLHDHLANERLATCKCRVFEL